MKRLFAFLLVLALCLPFCAAAEAPSPEPTEEPSQLDLDVRRIFKSAQTVAGEVVVAKDGKIVYQYCYGYANQKKRIAASPDHYYRLASVSKLVTAVAVMRLVETGRLNLDENLGTILGGDEPFFAANPKFPDIGITPRMLMSHTSTIWDSYFSTKRPLRTALNVKTAYKTSFYKEKPGTAYHYSNYGAGILGCVLEAVTGLQVSEAVSDLLFNRMDLDAAYAPQLLKNPDNITSRFNRPYPEAIDIDRDYYLSYGNCWMKCADLCRIGMMLCDYGLYNGEHILEEATVKEMLSSQTGKGNITAESEYGLNIARINATDLFPDRLLYGHQGRIDSTLCNLYFDPETRFVFAMVTNYCTPGARTYGIRRPAYTLLKRMIEEFIPR